MGERQDYLTNEETAFLQFRRIWSKYQGSLILGVGGLTLVGVAVVYLLFARQQEPAIQIIPAEESVNPASIIVDLQGAVEKPGVYELPAGSRLNDLLIRAGGLSATAAREWISLNLNLAAKLSDGQKIYLPSQNEVKSFAGPAQSLVGAISGVNSPVNLLNINTASASELESLPGIGEVRAKSIIQNRPYGAIGDLLTRKVVPKSVYEKIKERITL